MHIFHKWGKWEQYQWVGYVSYAGLLVPEKLQGKKINAAEVRQKRTCEICGKTQDKLIRDG